MLQTKSTCYIDDLHQIKWKGGGQEENKYNLVFHKVMKTYDFRPDGMKDTLIIIQAISNYIYF